MALTHSTSRVRMLEVSTTVGSCSSTQSLVESLDLADEYIHHFLVYFEKSFMKLNIITDLDILKLNLNN